MELVEPVEPAKWASWIFLWSISSPCCCNLSFEFSPYTPFIGVPNLWHEESPETWLGRTQNEWRAEEKKGWWDSQFPWVVLPLTSLQPFCVLLKFVWIVVFMTCCFSVFSAANHSLSLECCFLWRPGLIFHLRLQPVGGQRTCKCEFLERCTVSLLNGKKKSPRCFQQESPFNR